MTAALALRQQPFSLSRVKDQMMLFLLVAAFTLNDLRRQVVHWYVDTFFRRKEGQTFFEYIVLVSLAIMVSAAAYALYVTIKERFTAANTRIQSIPLE